MKRFLEFLLVVVLSKAAFVCRAAETNGLPEGLYAEITTESGVVVCELYYRKTPLTVASYVGLAEGTLGPQPRRPFFDGLKWHRVVPGFVVQGGDPTGTGEGDSGYAFPDEIVPGLRHDSAGVLQMANDGPDSNGSQYCLMLSPQPRLNYLHTVFGRAVSGLDVLPKIRQGDTMRVRILRVGADAKAFRADDAAFGKWLAAAKRYGGPRQPGFNAPFDDPDKVLPAEWERAKSFNFKLANFERFTGVKLAARVFAKPPGEAAGDKLASWLGSEAARLGVTRRGALAVYFVDPDEWHLFVGEASRSQFKDAASSDSFDEASRKFANEARARSVEAIARAEQAAPPGKPLAAAQKTKLKLDAFLDGLIFALEPR